MKTDNNIYVGTAHTRDMSSTISMEELDEVVYGDNSVKHRYAASNPLLTEEHIRHLFPSLRWKPEIYTLMKNANFPADLLHKLAVEDEDAYTLGLILQNPNVTPETRVVIALRKSTLNGNQ